MVVTCRFNSNVVAWLYQYLYRIHAWHGENRCFIRIGAVTEPPTVRHFVALALMVFVHAESLKYRNPRGPCFLCSQLCLIVLLVPLTYFPANTYHAITRFLAKDGRL